MPHELSLYDFELPAIEDWISGDNRTLAFTVTDADGNGIDIETATVSWALYDRPYNDDTATATLDDGDTGVEVVTDSRVDPSVGEFEVRIDSDATSDLYGEFWQRPVVEESDGSVASWRGRVVLTA